MVLVIPIPALELVERFLLEVTRGELVASDCVVVGDLLDWVEAVWEVVVDGEDCEDFWIDDCEVLEAVWEISGEIVGDVMEAGNGLLVDLFV